MSFAWNCEVDVWTTTSSTPAQHPPDYAALPARQLKPFININYAGVNQNTPGMIWRFFFSADEPTTFNATIRRGSIFRVRRGAYTSATLRVDSVNRVMNPDGSIAYLYILAYPTVTESVWDMVIDDDWITGG